MRFSATALLAGLAAASPIGERQVASGSLSADDTSVLQLAHYLENLELSLYSGGCNSFSDADYTAAGFPAGFRENVCVIAGHEEVHARTIGNILLANGVEPLPPCQYQFPYNDPKSFVQVANMVTSGGIGAYLGGAELLTDSATLEEAAGSILTVEARHDAYLRTGLGASPFPTNFDTGLTALWIFSLVQQFIVQCPQQLPLTPLPMLKLTSPMPTPDLQPPLPAGTTLTFKWDPSTFFIAVSPSTPLFIAIVNQNVSAPVFQPVQNLDFNGGTGSVPLPPDVNGTAFAALTTFSGGLDLNALSQYGTLAGPAEVVAS